MSLFIENEQFKMKMGENYLTTVRVTLFKLDANTANYWENELKKQNGAIHLERYIGELRVLSGQYHQMNGKISIIGTQLDYCISQLYELRDIIQKRKNPKVIKKTIKKNIDFITAVLTEVQIELGENEKRWYNEFSNPNSKTAKKIWRKFEEFNLTRG